MTPAFVAIVLERPFERMVRFVPPLTATFHELAGMGLFTHESGEARPPGEKGWRMTLRGRVAHWLACEINPRRRGWRTLDQLALYAGRYMQDGSLRTKYAPDDTAEKLAALVRGWVSDELAHLIDLRLVEADPTSSRNRPTWRLRLDT